MADILSRRLFTAMAAGAVFGSGSELSADEKPKAELPKAGVGPVEAPFERDYAPPEFKPSWKKPQTNRLLVQDFVIFAHMDLPMVKKLLDREPSLVLATMNWSAGDWESGLGAASHMGRRDIVEVLLERGARIDIFCAAMLGMTDVVKAFLTMQPKLIDAKGPHGFSLHFHAQVGGKESEKTLDYLQTVKKIELKPNPFLKKDDAPAKKPA
ncbi:ankyrin repeat domain-containing protein [Zavarzinella formosa]|uniref:ankyrin repeat domain-containing protein n=1 Tax=Zavarzinella formosa TaxID=360055 RepID=UPI0002DF6422|nr:ankyrin repeat domain-containing protein [Zavarzinella formosa]